MENQTGNKSEANEIQSESRLTFMEATSIIVGHGVGAGILAVPYLASRAPWWDFLWILAVAYAVNLLLHLMIAELSLMTTVECELCLQRVGLKQVLQQVAVFLLQITDTNRFLPVQPIRLSLLEVRVHLCVLALVVDSLEQVDHSVTTELTVLVVERTATANDLVNVLTDAQLAQLVAGDVHTDLVGLRTQRVVHHEHVPHLIADLRIEIFVKIRTAGFNLIHFR